MAAAQRDIAVNFEEFMEVDIDDEATSSWRHFVAGAIAGTAEHTGMFPIDTIKTHMQSEQGAIRRSAGEITRGLVERGGFRSLTNGLSAVAVGAAPAHAVLFGSWEYCKRLFGARAHDQLSPWQSGFAGVVATLLSDAIMTPMDAVKQRRQLNIRNYSGTLDCLRKTVQTDGVRSLYAGYTTALVMNVPYHFVYFPTYEFFRGVLRGTRREHNVAVHVFAGGGAGAVSAALTNPLDVARTRLQTQFEKGLGKHYRGMVDALHKIYHEEGARGFTRGVLPRMVFHSMAAGILWSTYEYMKHVLGADTMLVQSAPAAGKP